MLKAIGIYQKLPEGGVRKIEAVQKDKVFNRLSKFGIGSQLKVLEEVTLPAIMADMIEGHIYKDSSPGEYHYVMQFGGDQLVFAIVSRTMLERSELMHLLFNIKAIHQKRLQRDLQDVIDNPLGYTGKDLVIEKVKEQAAEVKEIMLNNMDKVIERGENLERLVLKAEQLAGTTQSFKAAAKKLNSSCCWKIF